MLHSFPYRSLTRSTTPHGTALLGETSAAMWRMRQSISSTSTWAKWLFYCSSRAETQTPPPPRSLFNSSLIVSATQYVFAANLLQTCFSCLLQSFLPPATLQSLVDDSLVIPGLLMYPFKENAIVKVFPMSALVQHSHIWWTRHNFFAMHGSCIIWVCL